MYHPVWHGTHEALLTLHQANILQRTAKEASMIKFERYATSDMRAPNRNVRSLLERSVAARALLKLFSVFGVSLVIAGTSFQLKEGVAEPNGF